MALGELLARLDAEREAVLGRRERARELRVVDARRVVGEVEVEGPGAVVLGLDVEVAAGAVRLGAGRRVEERDEQGRRRRCRRTGRGGRPSGRRRRRAHGTGTVPARSASRSRPSVVGIWNDTGSSPSYGSSREVVDDPRLVGIEVGEALEGRPLGRRDRAAVGRAEELVLVRPVGTDRVLVGQGVLVFVVFMRHAATVRPAASGRLTAQRRPNRWDRPMRAGRRIHDADTAAASGGVSGGVPRAVPDHPSSATERCPPRPMIRAWPVASSARRSWGAPPSLPRSRTRSIAPCAARPSTSWLPARPASASRGSSARRRRSRRRVASACSAAPVRTSARAASRTARSSRRCGRSSAAWSRPPSTRSWATRAATSPGSCRRSARRPSRRRPRSSSRRGCSTGSSACSSGWPRCGRCCSSWRTSTGPTRRPARRSRSSPASSTRTACSCS